MSTTVTKESLQPQQGGPSSSSTAEDESLSPLPCKKLLQCWLCSAHEGWFVALTYGRRSSLIGCCFMVHFVVIMVWFVGFWGKVEAFYGHVMAAVLDRYGDAGSSYAV